MTQTPLFKQVRSAVASAFFIPEDKIAAQTTLRSLKEIDSLSFEGLLLALEEETGVILEPEQWFDVVTVGDLVDQIAKFQAVEA